MGPNIMAVRRSSDSKFICRWQSPTTPHLRNDFPTPAPQSFVLFSVPCELGEYIPSDYKAYTYNNTYNLHIFRPRRDGAGARRQKGEELQIDAVLCGVVKWRRTGRIQYPSRALRRLLAQYKVRRDCNKVYNVRSRDIVASPYRNDWLLLAQTFRQRRRLDCGYNKPSRRALNWLVLKMPSPVYECL